MMEETAAYKNVCSAGHASGIELDVDGRHVKVSCPAVEGGLAHTSRGKSGSACDAGPAATLFATTDEDGDFRLTQSEALRVRTVLVVHERVASRAVCSGVATVPACFGHASGGDDMLDRVEYATAFMPCLMRGLPAECVSLLCEDAP
jgi:hypothetical protein